jgi:hypothetical protein
MLVYDYRYNYWHAKGEDPLMLYIPCNYSQVDWLMDRVSSPYAQWFSSRLVNGPGIESICSMVTA